MTVGELCFAAGLRPSTYWRSMNEKHRSRPSTIARLDAALKKLAGKPKDMAEERNRLVFTTWRAILAVIVEREGAPGGEVYEHDPKKRATLNAAWSAAALRRAQATYLAHVVLGVRQSDLAAALGLTPQAISASIQNVEDLRVDGKKFDRDLDWIARQLGAEV